MRKGSEKEKALQNFSLSYRVLSLGVQLPSELLRDGEDLLCGGGGSLGLLVVWFGLVEEGEVRERSESRG